LRNAIAMHLDTDGEWYKIDDVVIDAASATYDTTNFTDNAVIGPHEVDDWRSLWAVGDVFPSPVEPGAV